MLQLMPVPEDTRPAYLRLFSKHKDKRSWKRIALDAGASDGSIDGWMSGRHKPLFVDMILIADHLGIDRNAVFDAVLKESVARSTSISLGDLARRLERLEEAVASLSNDPPSDLAARLERVEEAQREGQPLPRAEAE